MCIISELILFDMASTNKITLLTLWMPESPDSKIPYLSSAPLQPSFTVMELDTTKMVSARFVENFPTLQDEIRLYVYHHVYCPGNVLLISTLR